MESFRMMKMKMKKYVKIIIIKGIIRIIRIINRVTLLHPQTPPIPLNKTIPFCLQIKKIKKDTLSHNHYSPSHVTPRSSASDMCHAGSGVGFLMGKVYRLSLWAMSIGCFCSGKDRSYEHHSKKETTDEIAKISVNGETINS